MQSDQNTRFATVLPWLGRGEARFERLNTVNANDKYRARQNT